MGEHSMNENRIATDRNKNPILHSSMQQPLSPTISYYQNLEDASTFAPGELTELKQSQGEIGVMPRGTIPSSAKQSHRSRDKMFRFSKTLQTSLERQSSKNSKFAVNDHFKVYKNWDKITFGTTLQNEEAEHWSCIGSWQHEASRVLERHVGVAMQIKNNKP